MASTSSGPSFIPLPYDAVFRWLFGSEHHKRLLAAFLSAAMPDLSAGERADLSLPDTHVKGPAGQKEVIFDVKAVAASGRSVDVEVQLARVPGVRDRFVLSNSHQVVEQLDSGDPYSALHPVVTLVVCGFQMVPEHPHDQASFRAAAREEGLAEGREAGRKEGREEGRTEGREEGRALERRRNIRAAVAAGLPAQQVADIFGVTPDEVTTALSAD